MPLHITLYEPEIPPNTGNIMRLCVNTNTQLHLVEPLGFEMDHTRLKRAGMDYRDMAVFTIHKSWADCLAAVQPPRIWACSTKGTTNYCDVEYAVGDMLVFGPESRGLPAAILDEVGRDHCLRIPMAAESRSLNIANSVAVFAYEASRQLGFPNVV